MTDKELIAVVNEIDKVLAGVDDQPCRGIAIGLFIGIACARQGGDLATLDEALAWLRNVAGYGMQMVAEGRISEARIN